jgi:lysophospholipid acyltransferase (LPLAT)-like uncharacterized protein
MMEKGRRVFVEMKAALAEGACVTMTATISARARRAGLGIVTLARASGRSCDRLCPSRRVDVKSWDRSTIAPSAAR